MGAIIGLRFAISVAKVLKAEKNLITFWSDSMNVIWWIRRRSCSFKPFIANRMGEIQASSEPRQWRHISTVMNPVDLTTRGMSVGDLKKSKLWWEGPNFLKWNKEFWPETKIDENPGSAKEVIKSQVKTKNGKGIMLLAIGPEGWR